MTMYRRILAVVAAVLVVAGVGGFFMLKESAPGPLTWSERARVTGYATSTIRGRTSGAVSVDLDGASAARIDAIVEGLPRANLRYICAENAQEYHITFSADAGAGAGVKQGFDLTGYWCNNLVVEVPLHGLTEDRIDRDCTLLSAVRRLLPASAIATHSGTCAHADGRLFLAVSRHATSGPKTASHQAASRKAASRKAASRKAASRKAATRGTPAHKPPNRQTPNRQTPKLGTLRLGTLRLGTPKLGTVKHRSLELGTVKLGTVKHRPLKRTPPKRETLNRGTAVRVMSRRPSRLRP
jgi:hypothetical protein